MSLLESEDVRKIFKEQAEKTSQSNEAAKQAQRQTVQRAQSALMAAIQLPEQIDRLTEQTGKLVEVANAQKQLAEEAGKQAENLSKQTDRLVSETIILRRFTRGVFWFSVVLSIFTLVLIVIAILEYSTKAHDGIKGGVNLQSPQNDQKPQ